MLRDGRFDPTLFRWMPLFAKDPFLQRLLCTTRHLGPRKVRFRNRIPGVRARTRRFLDAHIELMRNAIELLSGKLYLDGCKSIARAELFLAQPQYAECRLVLLVREPSSWCASWIDKRPETSVPNAISSWTEYVRRALALAEAFPRAKLLIVHYEDLCSEPEPQLRRILRFLDLEFDAGLLSADVCVEHHVLGHRMRLSFDGRVRTARYRGDELSASSRELIATSCRDLMGLVGY
jgi:hypothetical protein